MLIAGEVPVALLLALLLALALDALVGDPGALYDRVPHPVVLIGRLSDALERLRRPGDPPARQRLLGIAATLAILATAVLPALALTLLLRPIPWGWVVEGVVMSTLVAQRGLHDHVREVADGLDRGLEHGRAAVAQIVGRDPDGLDRHAVARAALESLAENLSDGVVAPAFWGLLLGLPGMAAYKAINTLDSMIGHRTMRHLHYGRLAARLDDLVNLVPARLTALLLAAAACLVPRARPAEALTALRRDPSRHRSPNAGWPEAAMAGALGLRLAGPRRYGAVMVADAWMGRGRAAAEPADIRRGLTLTVVVCALQAALLGVVLALAR
jgi:adenosylcobinamide-phosphate synthase